MCLKYLGQILDIEMEYYTILVYSLIVLFLL